MNVTWFLTFVYVVLVDNRKGQGTAIFFLTNGLAGL